MTLDSSPKPTLAIVSGRPGSGKTTLARTLATALSIPLVSRDEINEGILRTCGHDPGPAGRDRVTRRAFDAFFRVIEILVSCGATCVAEAAFQDPRWRIGLAPLVPLADIRVVHCAVDPELAHRRTVRRKQQEVRRSTRAAAGVRAADPPPADRPFEPLSLPLPSLHVATTDGYDPSLDEVVAFVTSGRLITAVPEPPVR